MKKQLTALSLLLCLLLTMVGCAAAGRTLDAAEDRVEAQLDIVEDRIEQ